MSTFRLRPGLTVRTLPDGEAVVAAGEGADAVIVNATAHAVLDLLTRERSRAEIVDVFHSSFPDQELAALEKDLDALIQELVRAGIVERCGDASSTV
jgi:hypothetical protein